VDEMDAHAQSPTIRHTGTPTRPEPRRGRVEIVVAAAGAMELLVLLYSGQL